MIPIKIVRDCVGVPYERWLKGSSDATTQIKADTACEYDGHCTGGNIIIRLLDGQKVVVHPGVTDCYQ